MSRKFPLKGNLVSPEEHGGGKKPPRGGNASRHEGGFAEGEYGRGPMPYKISHSGRHAAGQPHDVHSGTSGRGGGGIIGKGDGHKDRSADVEHPQSHAEFERLGGVDGGAGGNA